MEAAKMPMKSETPITPPIYEFSTEKVQTISLDLYSQSGRIEGKYGKPLETKPIQVWHLITMLLSMAEKNGLEAKLENIYVAQRDAHATLSDLDRDNGFSQKTAPINRWTFEKTISMIDIHSVEDEEANGRIGITLNKNGLSIAFGMNLHVCENFNVMGGTVLRAYAHGDEPAMPWEVMQINLNEWMSNLDQLWEVQTQWMESMKACTISKETPVIEEIFGDLYLRAIHGAYSKQTQGSHNYGESLAPFDTNELSKFAQELLRNINPEVNNVWDLFNWGTAIMKPETADIGEIANNSNDWANYLVARFKLDIEGFDD